MRTLAILLFGLPALAQQRPVWHGAFTAAQAANGRAAYREDCARCHGQNLAGGESTPELTGETFLARWRGKTAADLLDRTRKTMPTDNPGGLSASRYTDIVAFLLSTNGFTPGARELGGVTATTGAAKSGEWRY